MRAYFDKENIASFLLSFEDDGFVECFRMLNKHMDIFFNMTEEEFYTDEFCQKWILLLDIYLDGENMYYREFIDFENCEFLKGSIQLNNDFLKSKSPEDHSAIYFLSKESADKLESRGNYLVAGPNEELDILKKLIINEDTKFTVEIDTEKFTLSPAWSIIGNYSMPCSDIIIRDAFLFFNDKNQPYEKNIYSLIKTLTKDSYNTRLNIVFICLKHYYQDGVKIVPNRAWPTIRKEIKDLLEQDKIKASITFVLPYKKKDIGGGHDRTIFTNYVRFLPNDCLGNFYDSNENYVANSDQFTISCNVTKELTKISMAFINKMQTLIDEINNGKVKGVIYIDNPALSNYLKF